MIAIKLSVQSKEKEIIEFLTELKNILHSEGFNIDRDLQLLNRKRKAEKNNFQHHIPCWIWIMMQVILLNV